MRREAASLLALALANTIVLAVALTPIASADVFGPISLVSESSREQAAYAHDAAISGNGRYVVFDGLFRGETGVWRRDLTSGEVEQVAGGDAVLPSISESGQYVSFTTSARLARNADTNQAPDVYVRNMNLESGPGKSGQSSEACEKEERGEADAPYGQSCPFTLVSAVNGKAQGLTYEGFSGGIDRYGAVASGRTAISADGRRVAFLTTAESNLANPLEANTPVMQVAVRDIETQATQLVSVRDDPATGLPAVDPETGGPEPVAGREGFRGGAYSQAGTSPPQFKGPAGYSLTSPLGASISADGSTVAWMGINIAEQAKVLSGETDLPARYTEPLWRRIAAGPQAPTRRVTGGADPEDPLCMASGESSLPQPPSLSNPCQGPFYTGLGEAISGIWKSAGDEDFIPQLSADGNTVAFLAQAPLVSRFEGFGADLDNSDLYVADMQGSATRTEALQPLTELASGSGADLATTGPIVDLGLSPDGTQIAFSTQRTQFPLGTPAYVSEPMGVPGMSELFDVDLDDETLTRVTQGYEGGPAEHPHQEVGSGVSPYGEGDGALSPSFSDDGNQLAFSSTAANLVYGDGNTPALVNGQLEKSEFDGSDAFVVGRIPFLATPTETDVSSPPPAVGLTPEWRLGVTASALKDDKVLLYVSAPAAGRLSAAAESIVRVTHTVRARRSAHTSRLTLRRVSALETRRVSSTTKSVAGVGIVQVTLTLSASYRSLAATKPGLPATITVGFAAPGHRALSEAIPVSFKGEAQPAAKKKHARRASRR
jgi:hypothetical protein